MKFKDKVVLVTGSSRGIGRATALEFARQGANVVVNYIKEEDDAKSAVEEIERLGGTAMMIQADVASEDDVKRLIEKTVERFGGIDVLVNNAGIVFDVPIFEKTVAQWERTFAVNLVGTFLCVKYATPHMKGRPGASIVNISSTNGIDTLSPFSADYDASKAGVISLTRNLAQELGPDIRVNCVAPGWVDTDINKDLPADYMKSEIEKISLKRIGQPADIANVVLFLASEDASYITGATLKVDGGYK